MLKLLWLVCLTFLCLSLTPVLADEPGDITLIPQAAFGGRFKFGEWLPLFVDVENHGPAFTGELRVTITSQTGKLDFVTPADLPPGARKRYTLYILPNNFSRSAKVELVQDDETLRTAEVKLAVMPNDRYLIGVVAAETGGFTAISPPLLKGRRERADMIPISLAELPDRPEGLHLLDALVLNDEDTSGLTPSQQTALKQWVAGGGRLIVGGGAGAARTLSGLPPELAPVTLTGLQETTELVSLADYAGQPILAPGPFLAAAAQPVAGAVSLIKAGPALPLAVEQSFGRGYVDFIALDLTQAPFDTWLGTAAMVARLLQPGAEWSTYWPADVSPRQVSDNQMVNSLSNLPSLALPSIRLLGFLLIGYIILVGPVNYLVLRWRDRLAWAWLTIPALTLAFSMMAYGWGLNLRGTEIIINQVSLIELGPEGQASQGRTYVGVFSPSRQAYEVEVEAPSLIRPLGEGNNDPWSGTMNVPGSMSVFQGQPARVRGLNINQWAMQSFVADALPAQKPGLVAQLHPQKDGIRGQLVNQGDLTWDDVVVIFNGQFQKLGQLAPGQSAQIQLDVSQNAAMPVSFASYMLFQDGSNPPDGSNREIQFKQSVLDNAIFNNQTISTRGPLVIGWLADSQLPVRVKGYETQSQKISLLYGQLPLTFTASPAAIPPGFSRTKILSMTGSSGQCNYTPGIEGFSVYQGQVEAEVTLPDSLRRIHPTRFDLYLRSDGGWINLPLIELFDYTREQWVLLKNPVMGANPIKNIERFYQADNGGLRLRVSHNDPTTGGNCLYFDLAMEGESS